jgi:hypothetical protein
VKPEQDFEDLKRLLKLKRHEKPPPGYFNDFSGHIIAQIKAGPKTGHDNLLEWLYFEAPWMERLLASFQTKPLVSWGVGAAICAVIISTLVYTQSVEPSPSGPMGVVDTAAIKPASTEIPSGFDQPQTAQAENATSNSAEASLFDKIVPQTQPADWHP